MQTSAHAQQYNPVSVNNDVQVDWDQIDRLGSQPTLPAYLSPSARSVGADDGGTPMTMPGNDLIYRQASPRSQFLGQQTTEMSSQYESQDDSETVVIDAAGTGAVPTQSQFFGPSGSPTGSPAPRNAPVYRTELNDTLNDDGANQTIALSAPHDSTPAQTPRAKPASPAPSSVAATTPVEPQATPQRETVVAQAQTPSVPSAPPPPAPVPLAPAAPETPPLPTEESRPAEDAPAPAPSVPDASNVPNIPAPSPDTTNSPRELLQQQSEATPEVAPAPPPAPTPAPAQAPAPAAETASLPTDDRTPTAPAEGEYSLAFTGESFELGAAARRDLESVVADLMRDESLRVQLQAYATGDSNNASKARRLSLSRALQVRSFLIEKGVRSTRIDVRALGSNVPSGPADRVDVKTVQR
ncbi:OmpA family protein [Thalassospira sp.]|uniref:OmpA family protein n=1 Tax=Thalassospira sp. TaxID=1912094 RepID=UPI0027355313|nr:OmpA family protein [Thalassospira sp.]MDP2697132.1 OmpA family protein [Thalassospira sp.]